MDITPAPLKDYLQGRCSQQEAERVKAWLAAPENTDAIRAALGDWWTNYQLSLKPENPDTEQMLRRTLLRLEGVQTVASKPKLRFVNLISRIAAILFIPLCLLSVYLYFYQTKTNSIFTQVMEREVFTKPGTRLHFQLSDGTEVWLNDGTTMRYPEQFTGNRREVFVDGEAYFEVKADATHPFVVHNPMMTTVVTGTRFNLNAYSEDNFFEASLLEGNIKLEGKSLSSELKPGQQAIYRQGLGLETKEVKAQNATAWINGKLIIQNERLEMAIKKISRWYNIDIQLHDTELKNYELTCTLEDEKLEQCMALIANALDLKYNIQKQNGEQNLVVLRK